jgi:integrase/recombinase XerD
MKDTSQTSFQVTLLEDFIGIWMEQFIETKRSERKAKNTIRLYTVCLQDFLKYCDIHSMKQISQIKPQFIREYLLYLENDRGMNAGGQLNYYKSIRTFLNWYWDELDLTDPNPIKKVSPPYKEKVALQGIKKAEVDILIDKCDKTDFIGTRNAAIISLLFDSGLRANELCSLKIEDVDLIKGSVHVVAGKGNKNRYTFFGSNTRKLLRRYLRHARSSNWLFSNRSGDKLLYPALVGIVKKLANQCRIEGVSLHDFRRGFAASLVAKGVDILSISRMLGHTDVNLLQIYVRQDKDALLAQYQSTIDDLFKR